MDVRGGGDHLVEVRGGNFSHSLLGTAWEMVLKAGKGGQQEQQKQYVGRGSFVFKSFVINCFDISKTERSF